MDTDLDALKPTAAAGVTPDEYRALLRLAFVLCGSSDLAEDLVQDTYLRCASKLEGVANPSAYVRMALINRWRSHQRRRQVAGRWMERQRPPEPVMPGELAEWHDQLLALPARQRAVIVLRYLCELDDTAIGASIGAKPATVRSLAHRGLLTLRKANHDNL